LRCLEQIKIDVCAMGLPVTFIGVGTAYAYSFDGPTHHATEDIAIMRSLANMTIISPCDAGAAALCADLSLEQNGPLYIRLDRGKASPALYSDGDDFRTGCRLLRQGKDLAIIATGNMVHRAGEVADGLETLGIGAAVIDLYRLKPVNSVALFNLVGRRMPLVTIEEHTSHGGLGSIVAELMADAGMGRYLKRFALDDARLYAYGERDRLHAEHGLDREGIVKSSFEWLNSCEEF